jgi:hypothetical protein
MRDRGARGEAVVAGGNAEACGAGGDPDVDVEVGAGDIVWNIFGVAEDVILKVSRYLRLLKKDSEKATKWLVLRGLVDLR